MNLPRKPIVIVLVAGAIVALGLLTRLVPGNAQSKASQTEFRPDEPATPVPAITPQQAIHLALNQLESVAPQTDRDESGAGPALRLENPRHIVEYSSESGVTFTPRCSELSWNWTLQHIGSAGENWLRDPDERPVPREGTASSVVFDYGAFSEQYLAKVESIEQQFVLHEAPPMLEGDEDLLIRGRVECPGIFEGSHPELGWSWGDLESSKHVHLGTVTVFDADGAVLPAEMSATTDGTEIVVDGLALAQASYPVTVDPEIGANDFPIGGGAVSNRIEGPDIVYNPSTDEFLVVWKDEILYDIRAQRIAAGDGGAVGDEIEVFNGSSDAAPVAALFSDGYLIAAVDSVDNLRVRFVSAAGVPDPGGTPLVESNVLGDLAIAANPAADTCLLAWISDDLSLDASLISLSGGNIAVGSKNELGGGPTFRASWPSVAFDASNLQFCTVWQEHVSSNETRLMARLSVESGVPLAAVHRIDRETGYAQRADVVFNPHREQYFVAWRESVDLTQSPVGQNIMGLRLDSSLTPVRSPVVLSSPADPEVEDRLMTSPSVATLSGGESYQVVWYHRDRRPDGFADTPLTSEVRAADGQVLQRAVPFAEDLEFPVASPPVKMAFAERPGGNRLLTAHEIWDLHRTVVGKLWSHDGSGLAAVGGSVIPFGTGQGRDHLSANPDVCFNPEASRYLVTWQQERTPGKWHIYARPVGTSPLGEPFCLSLESDGSDNTFTNNIRPRVCRGLVDGFYVVWQSDIRPGLIGASVETEIVGRRIHGVPLREPTRLTQAGLQGFSNHRAETPDVSYNSMRNEFLVVYAANAPPGVPGTIWEIYAQVVAGNGQLSGTPSQVSNLSTASVPARNPALAWNSLSNDYYCVWEGTNQDITLTINEIEIIGQRLDVDGNPIGGTPRRISEMGPHLNTDYRPWTPDLAFNPVSAEYLVVWSGTDSAPNDREIYGQIITRAGLRVGTEMQISDMGHPGEFAGLFEAHDPRVSHEPINNDYLVTWSSAHDTGGIVPAEQEIFVRELSGTGLDERAQTRISDLGPDRNPRFDAVTPAVAVSDEGEFLIVFHGNDDRAPLDENRAAVFGQGYVAGPPTGGEAEVHGIDIEHQGGGIQISWTATPGATCELQQSDDLTSWSVRTTQTAIIDGNEFIDTDIVGRVQRFYRVVILAN